MTNTDKIKVKPYRNWVRGALGLFYLQKGLYPFTDSAVKAEHSKIVQKLLPCTGCAIENILPAHAKGKVCIQKNKAKCNCRKGTNRSCATCSKIYDDIVLLHRFREPHWVTDCSTWYTDHWQFAKCFLTTTSKGSSNTAAETDASGLLSIIINGEFFQSNIQCNIDPPNDIFSQVRDIRNAILHNSEQDLTDQEVTRYLQSMIAVLEDKKALSINPPAEAAAKKLKKILKDELIITMSEEAKVIQTALEAIKAVKEQSEESIRKLAEETYYSLRQQTSEFNTEIDGAKERGMEKVASTVSTVFGETYEPEIRRLKLGHEDHENRLKVIEAEQKELQRKQLELEQHVAKLKLAEEKYQTRIEYLKQKQALQQHLVDEYQKHYVKTWISPLNTKENDVNISDVYVSPKMVVDKNKDGNNENNTEKNGNNRGRNKNHIERYCDLFGTDEKRNRKIFIVGDVGTGKSSFCKMMMHNWCTSITKRGNSDDSGVIDEEGMTHEKENDMYDMNQFDFLFYIPLGEMPEGIVDTVDMIKTRSEIYRTLIDDIFTNLSDRILILADGLDEWAQPKSNRQSPHHGVPTSHFARNSTIITTSRPSSRGILNMKSSDYDLVITLVGLKNSSVAPMVEKYMKLLNETPTPSVRDFDLKTLSNLNVKDIQNAPMLLQQIIWLHCKGHNVGKSRSSVYSDIVNTVLAWELDKLSAAPVLHDFKNSSFEQLPLPKYFDSLERCQYNRNLLLLIGYIAYDAYIKSADSVSSLVFGRYKLNKLGVSDDAISAILRTGILTEVNCTDPTQAKSRLSFIHTSYVEFFAALYICSCYLLKVSDAYSSGTALTLLEGLIAVTPETSVAEILRLENVLIMICGLVTDLTEHVCECIYNVTLRDKSMDEDMFFRKVTRVQSLTFDCLLEHNSVDQHTVKFKLRHFYYGPHRQDSAITCFTDLDPTSIESCRMHYPVPLPCSFLSSFLSQTVSLRTLEIDSLHNTKDKCEGHTIDLTNHKELKCIKLSRSKISVSGINHTYLQFCEISGCELSHEQCSSLSSCLSQTVSLRTLELNHTECTQDDCEGHTIYCTNLRELQSIVIISSNIFLSGISHSLQYFEIIFCRLSHEKCSLLSSFLSEAVLLRTLKLKYTKCTQDECEGHTIDLTNHRELQRIKLLRSNISVSGINHTCLHFCEILDCKLSHDQFSSLSSCLSQTTSLQTLALQSIKCTQDDCGDHTIDLTNHRELRTVQLLRSEISVSRINHTYLQSCEISDCKLSHEQCSLLSTCMSQTTSLQTLALQSIRCTQDECEGHTIDLTNHRELQKIKLSWSKISVSGSNNACTRLCEISKCELSHEQCSLLSSYLSQAISLQSLNIYIMKCTKDKCEGHNIDLTNHRELQDIDLSDSKILISGINHFCPKYCYISDCELSHEQSSLLSSFLSQAVSLRTLLLKFTKCTQKNCEGHTIDLTYHRELQRIKLSRSKISVSGINHTYLQSCEISDCELSHEQCSSLSSFLSQTASLRNLEIDSIRCTNDECVGHTIDLTNHRELKWIELSNSKISVSGINHTCLILCKISDCELSHEQSSLLSSFLSQAVSLRILDLKFTKCIQDKCEGHTFDLTNYRELQRMKLSRSKISVFGINYICPQSCQISDCELSHEQCSLLSSFFSHAKSLRTLEICSIKCTMDECEGHITDLTNHKELQSITLSRSKISVSGINHICLQSCKISNCEMSREQCSLLSSCLSQAVSLQVLKIKRIKRSKKQCEGHTADLTNRRELAELVSFNSEIFALGVNYTVLQSCTLVDFCLSHEQCATLCTCLSHAENLSCLELDKIQCIQDNCEGHNFDLTNHKRLGDVFISNCKNIFITGINSTCPEWYNISNCNLSHEQCATLCICMSQAVTLHSLELDNVQCIENDCEGHYIDLTNHTQLTGLSISDCNTIFITGINPTWEGSCTIKKCNLSHEQCASLCSFLSHADAINILELSEIKCSGNACEGHYIDFTNQKELEEFSISNCNTISITGINPTLDGSCNIRNCNLSHKQCASICAFLSKAVKLENIELTAVKCTMDQCDSHFIDILNDGPCFNIHDCPNIFERSSTG